MLEMNRERYEDGSESVHRVIECANSARWDWPASGMDTNHCPTTGPIVRKADAWKLTASISRTSSGFEITALHFSQHITTFRLAHMANCLFWYTVGIH